MQENVNVNNIILNNSKSKILNDIILNKISINKKLIKLTNKNLKKYFIISTPTILYNLNIYLTISKNNVKYNW